MTLTASLPTEDASGNSIDDTRRIFGGMVATAADGNPRLGVIDPDPSTPIVTGTTSMAYLIKGGVTFVTQRDSSTGGVELSANDAVDSIATTTAPVANSRIDVIWIKCEFDAYGDSSLYAPTFGVTQGTADASPSVPSIPTGATALAHAEVTSTDTTTETVVITQVAPFTAMAGGVVPVRDATELAAWEPALGSLAHNLDDGFLYKRVGSGWTAVDYAQSWTILTASSGWTAESGSSTRPEVARDRNQVRFRGRLYGGTDGSVATVLPTWARPARNIRLFPISGSGAPVLTTYVQVETGGNMRVWGTLNAATYLEWSVL